MNEIYRVKLEAYGCSESANVRTRIPAQTQLHAQHEIVANERRQVQIGSAF